MCTWAALVDSMGYKKQKVGAMKMRRGVGCVRGELLGSKVDKIKILHMHILNFQTINNILKNMDWDRC